MRTVERFDDEVVAALATPGDPLDVAIAVAVRSVEWSVENPVDAFVLTMFRRTDLVDCHPAGDLSDRARTLGLRQRAAMDDLAVRLDRPADLVRFAVAGIAMAAIRRYVAEGAPVPAWVAGVVERTVRAALADDLDEGAHR